MIVADGPIQLPSYHSFGHAITGLNLPISAAELHGLLCGYLVAGGRRQGELYLHALLESIPTVERQSMALALFDILTTSLHQMSNFGFTFELLLPDEEAPLQERAQAFSEWCEGFTQGMTLIGVDFDALETEDAEDAVNHIIEFAQLDYAELHADEADERALTEVVEYTKMAVLSIHADIVLQQGREDDEMH